MYLIVGLGNPTKKYEKTRHNLGFDAIDELADKYGIKVTNRKFNSLYGEGVIDGNKVVLLKPQTFMNESGIAVEEICSYFKIDPEKEMVVLFDDISLVPGRIRIRLKGSAGGHNGVKSIIAHIKTDAFMRVKIGAGAKPEDGDLADHVLSRFSKEERVKIDEAIADAADAAILLMEGKSDEAMSRFNGKKEE